MAVRSLPFITIAAVLSVLVCSASGQGGIGMAPVPGHGSSSSDNNQPQRQPTTPNTQSGGANNMLLMLQDQFGKPYKILIHYHCNYSDGKDDIAEAVAIAKQLGVDILVITEHREDIELTKMDFLKFGCNPLNGLFADEMGLLRAISKKSGLNNYLQECYAASDEHFLVVAATEVGIGTPHDHVKDTVGRWDNLIHMLGIGFTSPGLMRELDTILGSDGLRRFSQNEKYIPLGEAQASVASALHSYGLATVIAHPYLPDPIHPGHHYTFYKDRIDDIDGVEFFNTTLVGGKLNTDPSDLKALEAMGFINRDSKQPPFKPMAVTSGCDYHGFAIPGLESLEQMKWQRQTAVFTKLDPFQYMQPGRVDYQAACQTVAKILRDPHAIMLAFAGTQPPEKGHLNFFCNGELMVTMGSDGSITEKRDVPAGPGDIIYMHIPGFCIMRMPIEVAAAMANAANAPVNNNDKAEAYRRRGGNNNGGGGDDGEHHGVQILTRPIR